MPDVANTYKPFSSAEIKVLEEYVERAERLKGSKFFQQPVGIVLTARPSDLDYALSHNDEETVAAMVPRLRHFYQPSNRSSFESVARMLTAHATARGSSASETALVSIESHERAVHEILAHADIGFTTEWKDVESGEIVTQRATAREIFNDWLYGYHLHDDAEKLARVEFWKNMGLHEFVFLQTCERLARCYYAFSGLAREVLAEPSLRAEQ